MELSRYDDFPAHQTSYPVSYIPSTDYAWDEGYYFAAYSTESKVFLLTGFRITPNADVIGGYAGVSVAGMQYSSRFSRIWSENRDTVVGPLRVEFDKPFRDLHLTMAENPSGISFDVHWLGSGPAHLSEHHLATNRGRRVTDQTRYNQAGHAQGWIEVAGERFEVTPDLWHGARDHSWGLYEPRAPLSAPPAHFLPPTDRPGARRALRFSVFFGAEDFSGHYHLHEDEEGRQIPTNDAFNIPFEGAVDFGWDKRVKFVSAKHDLTFMPGTRSMSKGIVTLGDEDGGTWVMEYETAAPPVVIGFSGYHLGSWQDGGSIHTYHGPDYIEWDRNDFRVQPAEMKLAHEDKPRKVSGAEHMCRMTCTMPNGRIVQGQAHVEIFLQGRFTPYGFEDHAGPAHGLTGRGIL